MKLLKEFLEKVKLYKEFISIIVVSVVAIWSFNDIKATASEALKQAQDTKKQTDIDREQIAKAINLLSITVAEDSGKLQGFLTAMGIDPDKAAKWSRLPKSPEKDSLGNIIIGVPWISISEDLNIGTKYRLVLDTLDTPYVETETLWDFTKK